MWSPRNYPYYTHRQIWCFTGVRKDIVGHKSYFSTTDSFGDETKLCLSKYWNSYKNGELSVSRNPNNSIVCSAAYHFG